MRDTEYIFAVARIRVLERSLLSDDDIRQMCGMPDVQSVVSYLADKGWGDGTGQVTADELIAQEQAKTLRLMHELRVDPKVFEVLSSPKYYHNVKCAIKEICTNADVASVYYDLDGFGREELKKLFAENDIARLPEDMRKPAARAFDVMSTTGDGQWCDVILDKACLVQMRKEAYASKSQILIDYVEATLTSSDIKIAFRAVRTGKDLHFLQEALAPCRDLDVQRLASTAVRGESELRAYLESGRFKDAVEALEASNSEFERWCDNRLIHALMPQKTNSVSVGPIVAYDLAKENELRCVRIIVTAKTNGFSEQETLERMREMYG
ncbi:MAG: V-type ATPase subunit [Atopobiaceae bacterium]|jgi:V/A-type H+-transporting ATPase subunit C